MDRFLDQLTAQQTVDSIRNRSNPIARNGYKITSQHEEDGIVEEIFYRMGITKPNFIEIGADMKTFENNSSALAMRGCKGVWIDMNEPLVKVNKERVLCISAKVTPRNIKILINKSIDFVGTKNINLLSLDIDSNDYHVLREIVKDFKFDCLIVEYNANWGKHNSIYSKFEENFDRAHGDYYGMSLKAAVNLLNDYSLICCNITGVNAFFIHNSQLSKFADCVHSDPASHFMPPTHKYYNFRLGGSITTQKSFFSHLTYAEHG